MVELSINIDQKQMEEADRKCGLFTDQKKIDAAINRAAKRAATGARSEAVRRIPRRYTVTASVLNEKDKYGNNKRLNVRINTGDGMTGASMIIRDSPMALPKFKGTVPNEPDPKNPQVQKVNVRKDTGVFTIPGWFPAQMKSGHIGIFKRQHDKHMKRPYQRTEKEKWGRKTKTKSGRLIKGREQIEQKFGPPTACMFNHPEVGEPVVKYAEEVLAKRIDHEIGRLLEK